MVATDSCSIECDKILVDEINNKNYEKKTGTYEKNYDLLRLQLYTLLRGRINEQRSLERLSLSSLVGSHFVIKTVKQKNTKKDGSEHDFFYVHKKPYIPTTVTQLYQKKSWFFYKVTR